MLFSRQLLMCLLITLITTPAHTHEVKAGDLVLVHPFARASAGPAKTGAAFLGIHNNGDTPDRLIAAHVDENVAKKAAIHTHIMEGDVAKMRKIEGGVEVSAHGMVMMQPGGLHIMLMRLKAPLEEGETFMLTLEFEHAGEIMVEVPILAVDAKFEHSDEMDGMDHGDMNHDNMDHGDMMMDQGEQTESN
jgi:periplasmic copper chaperone A